MAKNEQKLPILATEHSLDCEGWWLSWRPSKLSVTGGLPAKRLSLGVEQVSKTNTTLVHFAPQCAGDVSFSLRLIQHTRTTVL